MWNFLNNLNLKKWTRLDNLVVSGWILGAIGVLVAQLSFDSVMLHFMFETIFKSAVISTVLTMALVGGLAWLDIQIITADTTTDTGSAYMKWIGRLGFVLLLAWLTSSSLEVRWYHAEIVDRLNHQQKVALDKGRVAAIQTETDRIDRETNEVKAQLAGDATATEGNASADMVSYENGRNVAKQKMIEGQEDDMKRIVAGIEDNEEISNKERAGKGESGMRGCGDTCKGAEAKAAAYTQELKDKKTQWLKDLEKFDNDTQGHLAMLRGTRDSITVTNKKALGARLDALRKERKEKIAELTKMEPQKLVAIYGGTYRTEFGWLDSKRAFDELRAEFPSMEESIWICRLVGMVMGLLVLLYASSRPEAVVRFFSLGAQAEAGDLSARAIVEGMGNGNFANFALTSKARGNFEALHNARLGVRAVVESLEAELVDIVKADGFGLYPSLQEIQSHLFAIWSNEGEKAMKSASNWEEKVSRAGQLVPAWEPKKYRKDPREVKPWETGERELAGKFGWQSPDKARKAADAATVALVSNRLLLRARIEEMKVSLQNLIAGNTEISLREILLHLRVAYLDMILPVLTDIRQNEETVHIAGRTIPEWPQFFSDPRETLYDDLCAPGEQTLRVKYGWEGNSEPAHLHAV